jgi:hypothetical protein
MVLISFNDIWYDMGPDKEECNGGFAYTYGVFQRSQGVHRALIRACSHVAHVAM